MNPVRIRTKSRSLPSGLVLFLAALFLGAPRGVGAQAEQPGTPPPLLFGRTVVSIAYTTDGPVDRDEVARLISIQAGRPLTEEATGSTIRHLFATRRFSDVRIEAEPVEGGVDVTVHLFRSFRVNPLRFDDGVSISKEEMRRVITFSEGAVFQAGELEEGAAALKRRLDAEGYISGKVQP
ncbi:MAG TPA: POTRA domain-containing protein, partial [Thermoanaerobaculia bacterium]|nr:POTRA domain-containing protein [Thermoanaerobaculia bacterium]